MSKFLKIDDISEYKKLFEGAFFKTFFHSSEWESFLEKEFPWMRFEHYLWRDELLVSVARAKMFGREKVVSHPFCEYGGPLPRHSGLRPREGGPSPLGENIDFEAFTSDFKQEFGQDAKIKVHPYIVDFMKPKEGQALLGGPDPPLVTFWIEDYSKKSVEDIWCGLRKTLRQEIRNSEKSGLYAEPCKNKEELEQFYNIYLKTVKRHKNIPLPIASFNFFLDSKGADILFAKRDGKIIGGSVFLFYKPFIHYFLSASDGSARKYNAGHAVLWSAIQRYKGVNGYDYFDLGGTRKGSALETFKSGWGAKEHIIPEIGPERDRNKSGLKRKLWGILPEFFMKKLAPYALYWKI